MDAEKTECILMWKAVMEIKMIFLGTINLQANKKRF